jgi:hypothetical protein
VSSRQGVNARKRAPIGPIDSKRVQNLPTLSEIKKVPNGSRVLEQFVAAGMDSETLQIAIRAVVLAQILPPVRLQDVEGFSAKSLALFSEELRRTATRLETVREHLYYGTIWDSLSSGTQWKDTCKSLREYADSWEFLIRAVRKRSQDDPRQFDLRLALKRKLMVKVQKATGSPHPDWVADILNAAYDVAGLPLSEEASALRHLWTKVKKKAQYRKWALIMSS